MAAVLLRAAPAVPTPARRYHQVHHPVLQPAHPELLTTATDLEMVVGANCVDTLVEYDNKGVMREGLATSWDRDADTP